MLLDEVWLQTTPYGSRSTHVAVNKPRDHNRFISVPSSNIRTIDQVRMKEVDDLFKGTQVHRDQYKDRTGRLHPLVFFRPDEYKYQCAPGLTASYFSKYPQRYTEYKVPPVLPLTYGRRTGSSYISELSGVYNRSSCIAYKR